MKECFSSNPAKKKNNFNHIIDNNERNMKEKAY